MPGDPNAPNYPMTDAERQQLIASIPEFSAFESHKENILQKKEGRSAAELTTLFAMTDHDRTAYLDEQRAKFRQVLELELDELDDPLEPYVSYVAALEKCQTQGPTRELIDILEEVTRRFDDDSMYRSDIRYLVCWTKFARLAQDWQSIFKYLVDKQIGQTHARFYEDYAQIQEENGRYDDALATYRKGIEQGARPSLRLQRHFEEAKVRIQQKRGQEQTSALPRAILGEKATLATARRNSPARDEISMASPRREKFTVFSDTASPGKIANNSPSSSSKSIQQTLPFDVYRRKENTMEKSIFKGSTLKQTASKPTPAKFAVFRDDAESNKDEAPSHTAQQHNVTPRNAIATAGKYSFAYYMGANNVSESLPNSSARFLEWFDSVKTSIIRSEDSRGKPEWVAATRSNDNENGSEMSFEEMRALYPQYKLNMAPTTSFSTEDFEEKVVTPDSPTIETKAAMKIVGEIWTTAGPDFNHIEDMDIDSRPKQTTSRIMTDENGDARPMLPHTPTRRPLSIVSTDVLSTALSSYRGDARELSSPSKRRHLDTKQ
ncbi:hypothetical protein NQZ79_g8224 [Umbelopsis isabellina]|nr:hypothetical protein NQZ79_g8224 [Umbelopsis isabellina]